jgi:hypothetical protein
MTAFCRRFRGQGAGLSRVLGAEQILLGQQLV